MRIEFTFIAYLLHYFQHGQLCSKLQGGHLLESLYCSFSLSLLPVSPCPY